MDAIENQPERIIGMPQFSQIAEIESVVDTTAQKVKGRFSMGSQYHYHLEPQTCVVVPIEDGLNVFSATQYIDGTQMAVAEALKLPNNVINMEVRRVGGAYGAKITRSIQVACAAAIAAHLLNKTVRFIIEANMTCMGKRFACIADYDVDIDDNGKIQKLLTDFVEDTGCSFNEPGATTLCHPYPTLFRKYLPFSVHFHTTEFINNCYDHKTFAINAKSAVTDSPSSTWCRSPGTTEGLAIIENIMEHIARKVGKDPVDVRMNNLAAGSEMLKLLPDFVESVGEF
jgi:xanthine dehydrogenase/oxidase